MKYNLVRTTPFKSNLYNESTFNNFFDNFFNNGLALDRYFDNNQTGQNYMTVPRANVIKNENGYSIEMAAPGFSRDEFELNVDNNTLTVSVSTNDTPEYERSVTMREYKFQSFSRSWEMPDNTNVDGITARYEAGILYIDVPVESQRKGKMTISVQ
jgi:HSP20 family protein